MLYSLKGTAQHYVWGGQDYIPQWLGIAKQQSHYAEWWLGAHPSSPSMLKTEIGELALNEYLKLNPTSLGERSIAQFGVELPYLLKILDVEKPLSIQLHPTKAQAEIGFARENAAGISLSDPKRTYKDNNHKPEMMIALSDFWLLHGFKTRAKIEQELQRHAAFLPLLKRLQQTDLHGFYAEIMQADQTQLAVWLLPVIQQQQAAYQQQQLTLDNPDYWLLYSLESMQISLDKLDPGLLCFYLFNLVNLKTGEGIYQDAGIPHAYLRGQNIELMACSDNVIRGGLTPKHVDIDELLQVIDCTEITPQIIAPTITNNYTYPTPAQDFALQHIAYQQDERVSEQAKSAVILLVMSGEVQLRTTGQTLILRQGQSAFIDADTAFELIGRQSGYCVLAKLP
ncbi:mannose-6-phosphate isomerase, class I [Testudinibacter sp. TR-2022]|uniref:mannose-6-phosphate isomerase, class I n=1 Tax=Testudinibacter sp. TR-2022 TaxID=2585029 RepID=UPI00111903B8|nr:mannose-6-phosphate isomerase, class I [Testudinibacter sp. TR-2022]TNH05481.1 mannose-6-phosphate isomerase, class I [Pasteurellaceae bacterium Phil11]TNH21261.1 mannose-6-phosphate isomerase, class I [Testudinibacter sp. TR-2022]TNH27885.1 mannose-6-phosphate isomerase, class I [Testudinibacter sp. TR-2022]